MIHARKGGLLGALAARYVRWKVRHAFRGLWVKGAFPAGNEPVLAYANHTNFWDGFIAHQLCVGFGREGFCAMEEQNLARYPFLARLGAFSLRRNDAASALQSLRYARALLTAPGATVFLFPEGELRPFGAQPLKLDRGVEVLAKLSKVPCVPVAIRYAFFEDERPDVLVEIGQAHAALPVSAFRERLSLRVLSLAAQFSLEGFTRLLQGAPGVARRWDAVRALAKR